MSDSLRIMLPVALCAAVLVGCAHRAGPSHESAAVASVGADSPRSAAEPVPAPRASRAGRVRAMLQHSVRIFVTVDGRPVRSASGVVVAQEATPRGWVSYILTNAHVVEGKAGESPKFVVVLDLPTGDPQEFGAQLVAKGKVPEEDLAVLSVLGPALEPVAIAGDEELEVGADVLVVAAPYGKSLSVSGGLISQIHYEPDARHPALLKTDAAIGYGASGGGLFSAESGRLVGIVEGYRTAKLSIPLPQETFSFEVPMPGETFACPASKVRRFLQAHRIPSGSPAASGVQAADARQ